MFVLSPEVESSSSREQRLAAQRLTDGGWRKKNKMFSMLKTLSPFTLRHQEAASAEAKTNHLLHVGTFSFDVSMTALPFSQWRAEFQRRRCSLDSHGYAVGSDVDLLPSQPPPSSPRHRASTMGKVSHWFPPHLLTV